MKIPKLALNLLLGEQQFAAGLYGSYSPGRVIWGGVGRPSEAGQVKKSFISTFAYFFSDIARVQFLEGRSATREASRILTLLY